MAAVNDVTYPRASVTSGIVHFGVGNFVRSHEAMFIDRLLRLGHAREWGICGVGVMPGDARMRDALRSQDLEYTLVERCPDGGSRATRIGSIVTFLYAPDELESVLEHLGDPATRIVSLTITEGGYNISDATGAFDINNPAMRADAQPGARPTTVFGVIVAGLVRRRERGLPPFTIVSCDNVEGNGAVARKCFIAFATMVSPELGQWIADSVHFPNSMVDRITPVTTDEDRRFVLDEYGIADAWPVTCEPFVQWVLEDDFPLGRPPLELAGVQMVSDVRPYEVMKLRLLNASHQAMAYFGLLKGHVHAHEAVGDPDIARLVSRYMDEEATPTLDPVPGVDLEQYKRRLIERFANPYVGDTLARLATDGSDRIPKFVVPVARERRAAAEPAPLSASIVASWARYAEVALGGSGLPFSDRQREALIEAVDRAKEDPVGFLRNADWFGPLADDLQFASTFREVYEALRTRGAHEVLEHVLHANSRGRPRGPSGV